MFLTTIPLTTAKATVLIVAPAESSCVRLSSSRFSEPTVRVRVSDQISLTWPSAVPLGRFADCSMACRMEPAPLSRVWTSEPESATEKLAA